MRAGALMAGVLLAVAAISSFVFLPYTAAAQVNFLDAACTNSDANSQICPQKDDKNTAPLVKTIVDFLLYITMIASVIMIIMGGARYVMSGGDSNKVSSAKNMILYAVVGVVVSVLAWAIIDFVVKQVTTAPPTSPAGASGRMLAE